MSAPAWTVAVADTDTTPTPTLSHPSLAYVVTAASRAEAIASVTTQHTAITHIPADRVLIVEARPGTPPADAFYGWTDLRGIKALRIVLPPDDVRRLARLRLRLRRWQRAMQLHVDRQTPTAPPRSHRRRGTSISTRPKRSPKRWSRCCCRGGGAHDGAAAAGADPGHRQRLPGDLRDPRTRTRPVMGRHLPPHGAAGLLRRPAAVRRLARLARRRGLPRRERRLRPRPRSDLAPGAAFAAPTSRSEHLRIAAPSAGSVAADGDHTSSRTEGHHGT